MRFVDAIVHVKYEDVLSENEAFASLSAMPAFPPVPLTREPSSIAPDPEFILLNGETLKGALVVKVGGVPVFMAAVSVWTLVDPKSQ